MELSGTHMIPDDGMLIIKMDKMDKMPLQEKCFHLATFTVVLRLKRIIFKESKETVVGLLKGKTFLQVGYVGDLFVTISLEHGEYTLYIDANKKRKGKELTYKIYVDLVPATTLSYLYKELREVDVKIRDLVVENKDLSRDLSLDLEKDLSREVIVVGQVQENERTLPAKVPCALEEKYHGYMTYAIKIPLQQTKVPKSGIWLSRLTLDMETIAGELPLYTFFNFSSGAQETLNKKTRSSNVYLTVKKDVFCVTWKWLKNCYVPYTLTHRLVRLVTESDVEKMRLERRELLQELEQDNNHLKFRPGGPGFKETCKHFYSMVTERN
jgi:hypothetical protein